MQIGQEANIKFIKFRLNLTSFWIYLYLLLNSLSRHLGKFILNNVLTKLLCPCDMLWSRIWLKEEIEFWKFLKNENLLLNYLTVLFQLLGFTCWNQNFGAGAQKGWFRDQAFTPPLGFTEQVNKFILITAAKQNWLQSPDGYENACLPLQDQAFHLKEQGLWPLFFLGNKTGLDEVLSMCTF